METKESEGKFKRSALVRDEHLNAEGAKKIINHVTDVRIQSRFQEYTIQHNGRFRSLLLRFMHRTHMFFIR
jgi:hypothetical protein